MLAAREPGISVLPSGGLTGEGARIRIRGAASLSQPNEPIVYVDGVRVDRSGGFGDFIGTGGGGYPSRLDDFNPEAIEHIEILKGAAAATLYGTEASAGVIQVFTKPRPTTTTSLARFRPRCSPDPSSPSASGARCRQAPGFALWTGRSAAPSVPGTHTASRHSQPCGRTCRSGSDRTRSISRGASMSPISRSRTDRKSVRSAWTW